MDANGIKLLPAGTRSVQVTAPEPLKKAINPRVIEAGSATWVVNELIFLQKPKANVSILFKLAGSVTEVR